jgi:hypothetical protein
VFIGGIEWNEKRFKSFSVNAMGIRMLVRLTAVYGVLSQVWNTACA